MLEIKAQSIYFQRIFPNYRNKITDIPCKVEHYFVSQNI